MADLETNKEKIERMAPQMAESLAQALAPEGIDFENRNKVLRDSFIDYLFHHPQERFFQALRNWARENIDERMQFLMWSEHPEGPFQDTFYPEYGLQKVRKDT